MIVWFDVEDEAVRIIHVASADAPVDGAVRTSGSEAKEFAAIDNVGGTLRRKGTGWWG